MTDWTARPGQGEERRVTSFNNNQQTNQSLLLGRWRSLRIAEINTS